MIHTQLPVYVVAAAGCHRNKLLRTIDMALLQEQESSAMEVIMSADYDMRMMVVRVPKEYDLVGACHCSVYIVN